jgi:hypothetical protein
MVWALGAQAQNAIFFSLINFTGPTDFTVFWHSRTKYSILLLRYYGRSENLRERVSSSLSTGFQFFLHSISLVKLLQFVSLYFFWY